MKSGHGPKHVQCVTHDTNKALVQTTEGLIAVCKHFFQLVLIMFCFVSYKVI